MDCKGEKVKQSKSGKVVKSSLDLRTREQLLCMSACLAGWSKGTRARKDKKRVGVARAGRGLRLSSAESPRIRSIRGETTHDNPWFWPIDGYEDNSNKKNNQNALSVTAFSQRTGKGRASGRPPYESIPYQSSISQHHTKQCAYSVC
jgi:hypothetical protein